MNGGKRSKDLTLLWAFMVPTAVFFLTLFRCRILPFGDHTLLYSDMDSQYIEFMAEYRRILAGQGSFFYSRNAGLGMNFWALTAYYLASPFNLLLILFSEDRLPLAVSLITGLKLGCAGLAFAIYLRALRALKAHPALTVLFSGCYALSSWAVGYVFNIMWLDALIWLPLLCAFIEKLIRGERFAVTGLILCFAISFLSQFYMAYMSGVFCALYFLTRLFTERVPLRRALRLCAAFAAAAGIAAGLSAFLLLPTFLVLKNNMGLLGQDFPAAVFSFPLYALPEKLFVNSFDGIKDCLPHIYCGIPVLIGLCAFFFGKQIPTRRKIASGGLLLFLILSFWFAPLDFLWHAMDHPSWFPYRYAFVFCFFVCGLAFQGLEQWEHFSLFRDFYLPLIPAVLLLVSCFGGAADPGFLALNGVLLAGYGALLFFLPRKGLWLILLLCCAELFLNCGSVLGPLSSGSRLNSEYIAFRRRYRDALAEVLPKEDDFYRIEKTDFRNYNDPLGLGYPGVSHFSSTASVRQTEFLKRLGFNCYATWCTYQGSTPVSDALLGIRYELGPAGKTGSIAAGGGIWENPARLPLFFFASEEYLKYDFFSDDVNTIERRNDLMGLLDGAAEEPFYTEIPVRVLREENLGRDGEDYIRTDMNAPAFLEIEIEPDPEKSSCLFLPGASLNYNVVAEDTHELINAYRDYAGFPVCLDAYADSGRIKIRVETTTDGIRDGIWAYELDPETLAKLTGKVSAAAPAFKRLSDTVFELHAAPTPEDRFIVSSIPFDSGWRVRADGKDLPLKAVYASLLGFTLPAGCERVEVSFLPYGLEIGILLSGIALLMWTGVFILEKRKAEKNE